MVLPHVSAPYSVFSEHFPGNIRGCRHFKLHVCQKVRTPICIAISGHFIDFQLSSHPKKKKREEGFVRPKDWRTLENRSFLSLNHVFLLRDSASRYSDSCPSSLSASASCAIRWLLRHGRTGRVKFPKKHPMVWNTRRSTNTQAPCRSSSIIYVVLKKFREGFTCLSHFGRNFSFNEYSIVSLY